MKSVHAKAAGLLETEVADLNACWLLWTWKRDFWEGLYFQLKDRNFRDLYSS